FADALKDVGSSNVLELRLTRTGGMTGTPAYMAPEQYLHHKVDARTDQFSFCVALYEGLYGERPFVGQTVAAVRKQVIHGIIADEPSGADVPPWLRKIVVRGLSVHPAERYASMDALLAELSNDPDLHRQRNRRRVLLGVSGAALIAASVMGYRFALKAGLDGSRELECKAAATRLKGIWDDRRKAEIRDAFLATKLPYAQTTWEKVEAKLDDYTRSWSETHDEACRTAETGQGQSLRLRELSLTCLDERHSAIGTLSGLLVQADATTVNQAMAMTRSLGDLELCADPERLLARAVDLPEDPAMREAIKLARKRLDEAELRQLAGQYESGLQLATELTESADELEFLPLRAEAWLRRGALEEKSGDYANAEFSLRRALWAAEAGRHDEVAVDGLTLLLGVVGDRLARHEDTKALTERLTAALARLGDDNLRKAQAYNTIGRVYASQGEYEEAVKLQLKAVRLGEQLFDGGNHPVVATFLLDLGQAHESLDHDDEARARYERALAILEESLGERHPDVAAPLTSLGNIANAHEDYETARKHFERVLEILESTVDADHPGMAHALYGLGVVYEHRSRWQRAERYFTRALDIWSQAQGPDHPQNALALLGRCRIQARKGSFSKALADCERALAIRDLKTLDPGMRGEARFELARVRWEANSRRGAEGDTADGLKQALKLAREAREEYEKQQPRDREVIAEIDGWLKERNG
ncbi:MAG: tetratricopeptide repeat protein, partial [Myxococcales bacterium]|nr:tetratricopeptide repeat protein [Myxococcales bacterium]